MRPGLATSLCGAFRQNAHVEIAFLKRRKPHTKRDVEPLDHDIDRAACAFEVDESAEMRCHKAGDDVADLNAHQSRRAAQAHDALGFGVPRRALEGHNRDPGLEKPALRRESDKRTAASSYNGR